MSRRRSLAACLLGTCLLAPWRAGAQVGVELALSAGFAAAHRSGAGAASGARSAPAGGALPRYASTRNLGASAQSPSRS